LTLSFAEVAFFDLESSNPLQPQGRSNQTQDTVPTTADNNVVQNCFSTILSSCSTTTATTATTATSSSLQQVCEAKVRARYKII
jgi:hypothetical protein